MNWIKKIIDFSISSSIWVAIAVYALTHITYISLNLPIDTSVLYFIFFGSIAGYNFVKYYDLFANKKEQFLKLKALICISVFSSVMSAFFFFNLSFETQLFILLPLLLTLFYTVSFSKKTLRTIAGLKIYVIALCWALVTVGLPVLEEGDSVSSDMYIELFQRFLFVLVLTLPFEIRDLSIDNKILATIPQKIGVLNTKILGMILIIVLFLLEFFKDEMLDKNIFVLPLVLIMTLLSLIGTKKEQTKYYTSFFVEGIPIFWLVLLLLS